MPALCPCLCGAHAGHPAADNDHLHDTLPISQAVSASFTTASILLWLRPNSDRALRYLLVSLHNTNPWSMSSRFCCALNEVRAMMGCSPSRSMMVARFSCSGCAQLSMLRPTHSPYAIAWVVNLVLVMHHALVIVLSALAMSSNRALM